MTILADFQIRELGQSGMIVPFSEELMNPASYDLTLGENIMIESAAQRELVRMSIAGCSREEPFMFRPQEFILAETEQMFHVPGHVSAQFLLKSSVARAGVNHLLAGWIDPGFNGSRLTLELKNVRQLQSVPLWPGMRIGQLVVHRMDERPVRGYEHVGRYNGDRCVTPSKGL